MDASEGSDVVCSCCLFAVLADRLCCFLPAVLGLAFCFFFAGFLAVVGAARFFPLPPSSASSGTDDKEEHEPLLLSCNRLDLRTGSPIFVALVLLAFASVEATWVGAASWPSASWAFLSSSPCDLVRTGESTSSASSKSVSWSGVCAGCFDCDCFCPEGRPWELLDGI